MKENENHLEVVNVNSAERNTSEILVFTLSVHFSFH